MKTIWYVLCWLSKTETFGGTFLHPICNRVSNKILFPLQIIDTHLINSPPLTRKWNPDLYLIKLTPSHIPSKAVSTSSHSLRNNKSFHSYSSSTKSLQVLLLNSFWSLLRIAQSGDFALLQSPFSTTEWLQSKYFEASLGINVPISKLNLFVTLLFFLHMNTSHWEQFSIIEIEASSFLHFPGHLFQLFHYFVLMTACYPYYPII